MQIQRRRQPDQRRVIQERQRHRERVDVVHERVQQPHVLHRRRCRRYPRPDGEQELAVDVERRRLRCRGRHHPGTCRRSVGSASATWQRPHLDARRRCLPTTARIWSAIASSNCWLVSGRHLRQTPLPLQRRQLVRMLVPGVRAIWVAPNSEPSRRSRTAPPAASTAPRPARGSPGPPAPAPTAQRVIVGEVDLRVDLAGGGVQHPLHRRRLLLGRGTDLQNTGQLRRGRVHLLLVLDVLHRDRRQPRREVGVEEHDPVPQVLRRCQGRW